MWEQFFTINSMRFLFSNLKIKKKTQLILQFLHVLAIVIYCLKVYKIIKCNNSNIESWFLISGGSNTSSYHRYHHRNLLVIGCEEYIFDYNITSNILSHSNSLYYRWKWIFVDFVYRFLLLLLLSLYVHYFYYYCDSSSSTTIQDRKK